MDEAVALPGNVGCRTNSVFIMNIRNSPISHSYPSDTMCHLPYLRGGVRNALLPEVAAKASQTE